jgi:transcriptional regulator with XRE-family HTH domain
MQRALPISSSITSEKPLACGNIPVPPDRPALAFQSVRDGLGARPVLTRIANEHVAHRIKQPTVTYVAPSIVDPEHFGEEEILRRLGQRIREIRIQRGFKSQEEFADLLQTASNIRRTPGNGAEEFSVNDYYRVAELLGVTLEELFAGLETGKPVSRKRPRTSLDGIARELTSMERSLQRLKDIVSPRKPPPKRKRESRGEPRRQRATAPKRTE